MGNWRKCPACEGTRHVQVTIIPCLYCAKPLFYTLDSNEANGVFNSFCDGACEDRYAAKL